MFEQVELENLARAGYMLVMKDKEAPTPPKVRQLISRMYREMRAGIAKRDRSGGGPQGDAQSGGRRGWNGSLWRVSGRGGRGGHALTRHRPDQGGGLVDGDYIGDAFISSTVTASSMMGAAGHVNEVGRGSASM